MDPRTIAVATMTWVRTADEDALVRRSLLRLAAAGLPIVVADRSHNPRFTRFLESLPSVVITTPSEAGLLAQVKAALATRTVRDARFVLYTEPDKDEFFASRLRRFVAAAADDDGLGIVIAARTEDAFATFPPMQRYTEKVANELCAQYCGGSGDYFYGPFIARLELLPLLADADPTLGWGWRPFLFRRAHLRGWRTVHIAARHECPVAERDESDEDRVHRLRQLQQNIAGLIA